MCTTHALELEGADASANRPATTVSLRDGLRAKAVRTIQARLERHETLCREAYEIPTLDGRTVHCLVSAGIS